MRQFVSLLGLGLIFLTSCSTPEPLTKAEPKFHGTMGADIVIRYYSEDVNRVLKPLQMEGPFLTTFSKGGVLDLAKQQAGRDLAVVIMLRFNCSDPAKREWLNPLTQIGYKRVVFLRAVNERQLEDLPILETPTALTGGPKAPDEPKPEHSDAAGA
jgi:hypothetical protein